MSPEANVLCLAGSLDIYAAETVRAELRDRLADKPELVLDLAGIEHCDTAGLQLLLAAQRTAREAGKSFEVNGASNAILEVMQQLGLARENLPTSCLSS